MYVYGRNVAKEIIESDIIIHKAFVLKGFDDEFILNGLRNMKIEIEISDKFKLDGLVKGAHQGIVMSIEDYKYETIDSLFQEDAKVVILDHLEDPHNFGAIIRTCEAAGITGVIIPKDRSALVTDTVFKTSAGTVSRVKIVLVANIVNSMKTLKDNGFWIVGTDMDGQDFKTIDYSGKIAIVVGNEGDGMSRLVRENCDFIATIPMFGTVNSLNASVATGLVIYESIRNRK